MGATNRLAEGNKRKSALAKNRNRTQVGQCPDNAVEVSPTSIRKTNREILCPDLESSTFSDRFFVYLRSELMMLLWQYMCNAIGRHHGKRNDLVIPHLFELPDVESGIRTQSRSVELSPRLFFFAKKISNFAYKCKILQAEKANLQKFCNVFTQPNFSLCNGNNAVVHPQSPIFSKLNVEHV